MKKVLGIVLAFLLVLPLLLATGCSGGSQKTLTVCNAGDYIEVDENGVSQVLKDFEKETGIKVVYTTFTSNEELYAKLSKSSSLYDVIVPSDYMVERMAKAGMLEELDKSKIPNFSNIDSQYQNMAFDPDGKYSVPYMLGTLGIVYNKDMVTDPVNSWSILWDKKYSKKILMYDSSRDSITVGLYYKGFKPNTNSEDELKQAEQALIDQKPLVLSYTLDDTRDKMLAGEAAMAVVYSGDATLIMQEAKQNGMNFGYCIPKEGSNIFVDNLCVVKGTKHKDEAEAFINFMCRVDICTRNAQYIGYAPPENAAYKNLTEDLTSIPSFYPTDEEMKRLTTYRDLGDFNKKYEEAWTRIKAAQ
jgi:spermidine/putrescine transport system substrate-binding protein